MSHFIVRTLLVLSFGLAASVWAQTVPVQPQDPTAQSPATSSTPKTFPEPLAKQPESTSPATHTTEKVRPFMGSVVLSNGRYALRAGDLEYKLDDQGKAKSFQGRNVKIMGSFDKRSNTIHVETIEPSSSM